MENIIQSNQTEISTTDLKSVLDSDQHNYLVVDVRTPAEWQAGHIDHPNVTNIDINSITTHIEELKAQPKVFLICQSGGRSSVATTLLRAQGINATNVNGGMNAWSA